MKLQMELSHEPRSNLLNIDPEQTFSLQSELISTAQVWSARGAGAAEELRSPGY